jgi:hypothetical protein
LCAARHVPTCPQTACQEIAVALENFAVVNEDQLADEVIVEFWDGADRCTAVVKRSTFDDAFDPLLLYGSPRRRLDGERRRQVVQENLPAFERMIAAAFERDAARSATPVRQVEVTLSDIRRSGETFTRNALLDGGLASRSTGTRRRPV